MRNPARAVCLFSAFLAASCASRPVDAVIARAWSETEGRWISKEWHLTTAEAEAQIELYLSQHPGHKVTYITTPGPLPAESSDKPMSPEMRKFLFIRDR